VTVGKASRRDPDRAARLPWVRGPRARSPSPRALTSSPQHAPVWQPAWLAYVATPAQPLRGPGAAATVVEQGDAPHQHHRAQSLYASSTSHAEVITLSTRHRLPMCIVCRRLAGVFAPRVVARALSCVTHRLLTRHCRVVRVVRVRHKRCFAFVAHITTHGSRAASTLILTWSTHVIKLSCVCRFLCSACIACPICMTFELNVLTQYMFSVDTTVAMTVAFIFPHVIVEASYIPYYIFL
jgi:hypothetical protein